MNQTFPSVRMHSSKTMQELENNGCNLAFRVIGRGPPVLFIQGVSVYGDGWQPQVENLSKDYSAVVPE